MSGGIDELIAIMDRLLGEGGCPWDREQTHNSLARYLIEETYEVLEAINEGDMNKLREELGDLLLQVVFHSALAEREGQFTFDDVARTVANKMVDRHPHVFGDMDLKTSNDVLNNWEQFKKKEGKKRLLEGIPEFLPALMRAEKIQEKAARVGFDWPTVDGALEKFQEEVEELSQAETGPEIEEEMGDVIFALVNIARLRNIEPEQALQASNHKFSRRIEYMEDRLKEKGHEFKDLSLEELDLIWEEAKQRGL
ncbi:MAG TPA: nucleoside triphosphate pyrophosphohydrolase [Syntrophomonas sp.]|jgi:tetrapyrrole methylase family protein/MazG family protein|nr:nucleoside triphosphate pyrophosphohydrolase [Syntrophomonas sp.]HCF71853.1 nucleoside triphosphate pyrophosphohydrolase [Syntrophomonas sp.]